MKIETTEEERELLLEQATNIVLYGKGNDEDDGYKRGLIGEINRRVDAQLDKLAADAFNAAVTAEVSTRVQAILDEGWQPTTPWGDRSGKKITIRELILEKLNTEVGDSYRNNKMSLVRHLVHEAVKGELGKELAKELERAKTEIRAAVDGLIKEKLTETLRAALGLR